VFLGVEIKNWIGMERKEVEIIRTGFEKSRFEAV